jgi:hypothetical protein
MRPPRLHDRGLAELIRDSEALAPIYTPEWTGAEDPHDPGRALLVLAARLVELLAERVNRVPEKNLLAFLDFVGVERAPGLAAEAPVTFQLSARVEEGQQIPVGTQVATTQSEAADAQVFETRNGFFATLAGLPFVFNILPGQDRYGVLKAITLPPAPKDLDDTTRAIDVLSPGGSNLRAVPHELYLASAALFGRPDPSDLRLDFTLANPGAGAFAVFSAAHLAWQRFNAASKQWEDIANVSYPAPIGNIASVQFAAFPGTGKSAVGGDEDFWIVGRLRTAPSALAALPILSDLRGAVATAAAPTAAPDAALFNDTPLDLSKPAFPFGERPRYGDAFHIGSAKAFGTDVASASVQITLRPYTLADLQAIFNSMAARIITTVEWQYLAAGGVWKTIGAGPSTHILEVAAIQTSLAAFQQLDALPATPATALEKNRTLFGTLGGPTAAATITFAPAADAAIGKVAGVSARWIRAVLRSQAPYGKDGFVTFSGATPVPVKPTFVPPVIEKLDIAYTYNTASIALDRITTANNFEFIRRTPPFFSAGQTLAPFVPLDAYAPDGAAGFLGGTPALYLGFDRELGTGFISLLLAFVEPRGTAQLMPETGGPRVVWEYLAASGQWKSLDVRDGTADLTSTGVVAFPSPPDSVPRTLFPDLTASRSIYWYRARLQQGHYTTPPRLTAVLTNTVMADNQQTVRTDWVLASGSGEPGQRATILLRSVLGGDIWVRENEIPTEADWRPLLEELREQAIEYGLETLPGFDDIVQPRFPGTAQQEIWVRWVRVPNFRVSGARSRHYTLEAPTGEVTFGNGREGLIPPIGKDNIVVRDLRSGGGEAANRLGTPLAIKELKSSLPFVDTVFNVSGAVGGTDAWTLERTFDLGPQAIKNRRRAVTTEDYEWVTLEVFGQVARAKALATTALDATGALVFRPGAVAIIVVPKGVERTPQPPKGLLRRIEAYLRSRAFEAIAAEILALPPTYQEVSIAATVHPRHAEEASLVERRVVQALEAFFHPLTGGERREGWPFGRSVHISEVFAAIERTPGVDYVASAAFIGAPGDAVLSVKPNVLVASGTHQMTVV